LKYHYSWLRAAYLKRRFHSKPKYLQSDHGEPRMTMYSTWGT
jgi:hypothetical protein